MLNPVQNKLFGAARLLKRHSRLQKSTNELQMSSNGSRLGASDREKAAHRTAPAALRNFGASQTGRHRAFELQITAIRLNRSPVQALAQSERFHLFPEAIWNRRCKAAKMTSSFNRLLVRIWPTMAVFKCAQEANSLAGQRRLLARRLRRARPAIDAGWSPDRPLNSVCKKSFPHQISCGSRHRKAPLAQDRACPRKVRTEDRL